MKNDKVFVLQNGIIHYKNRSYKHDKFGRWYIADRLLDNKYDKFWVKALALSLIPDEVKNQVKRS